MAAAAALARGSSFERKFRNVRERARWYDGGMDAASISASLAPARPGRWTDGARPIDPVAVARELDADGAAVVPGWLDAASCRALRERYVDDALFRSTVTMERHGFGRGEYRYFGAPLPDDVRVLRETLYAALVPVANDWMQRLGRPQRFPATLPLMLDLSAAGGQTRPAALLLRYGSGDYNALHQDVYGPVAFALQGTVLLSEPGIDFAGGEFVLVEGRARRQSVAHVVPLALGDLVIFPNRDRPAPGGGAKSVFRHGVAKVRSGERYTLGLILHDA